MLFLPTDSYEQNGYSTARVRNSFRVETQSKNKIHVNMNKQTIWAFLCFDVVRWMA